MAQSYRIKVLASVATIAAATGVLLSPIAPNTGATATAHGQSSQRPAGYADIVDKVKPAVVSVRVNVDAGKLTPRDGLSFFESSPREHRPDNLKPSPNSRGRSLMTIQGSGFFISVDGYAVTSGHVVENAKTVEVTTDGGKTYSAKVIGSDSRTDIALMKVEGSGFPLIKFAEASPRVGDLVLAIGNPFGLGGTVTAGIVSAQRRDIDDGPYEHFIQIDASVNRGNSSGPTFDMDGNVKALGTVADKVRRCHQVCGAIRWSWVTPQFSKSTEGL
jgi:serine protease Do